MGIRVLFQVIELKMLPKVLAFSAQLDVKGGNRAARWNVQSRQCCERGEEREKFYEVHNLPA